MLSWVLAGALVYLHKDRVQLVKLPPESLADWYKPQNKRHVWLHNMFKLRREMQALGKVAVSACAQCHGTHRIAFDTQQLIGTSPGFIELLKH